MAVQVSPRRAARRIAKAIRDLAGAEGMLPGDYAVVAAYDRVADRLRLVVGSVRPIDPDRWRRGIFGAVRESFPEDPDLASRIGLVVRRVSNLDEVYRYAPSEDDQDDLSDMFDEQG